MKKKQFVGRHRQQCELSICMVVPMKVTLSPVIVDISDSNTQQLENHFERSCYDLFTRVISHHTQSYYLRHASGKVATAKSEKRRSRVR